MNEPEGELAHSLLNVLKDINGALLVAQKVLPDTEFIEMRKNLGDIAGYLVMDVLNPYFRKYPKHKPPELM